MRQGISKAADANKTDQESWDDEVQSGYLAVLRDEIRVRHMRNHPLMRSVKGPNDEDLTSLQR